MRSSMVRRVAVCVLAVAGCSSGGDQPVTTAPASPPPTTDDQSAAAGDESRDDDSGAEATSSADETQRESVYAVTVDVSVDRFDLSEQLEVAIDPADLDEIDPFTRFSSCSGLRASIGTFTVTAVDDTAAVRSVSVGTADNVDGPGIHDAEVRVETATAGTASAVGTVTLDQSLRSGSFQAFEATGESVSGTFVCDGPPGAPVPIVDADAGDDDGVLRVVEVVALLRRGDEERIVGLTLDTAEVAAVDADCPGVTGSDGPSLVSVDGGPAVGAITTFELVRGLPSTMRMRVGGATYEVDDVTIDVDDRGAAGTFSGVTGGGIAIDGAFRCA
jgi:hypothetical protein